MAKRRKTKPGRPKADQPMKIVGVRLPVHLIDQLRSLATDEGLPYQTYLRKVLWDHIYKSEESTAKRV